MATPTISEYTAHLRQDKAGMREHLINANIATKESDTFTDLSRKILEKGNAIRRIYVQPDEPMAKEGLWFKRDTVEDFDVVSDPVPFIGGTLVQGASCINPDSDYAYSKETYWMYANNHAYYICLDRSNTTTPNETLRIYKYDYTTNTFTKAQTYTSDEVMSVRGESSGYYKHSFSTNSNIIIDDAEDYMYVVGGHYNGATAESNKYITRFGINTHDYKRVHTKTSNWFSISSAGTYQGAQIVGNKIYVFGYSTTASSYGNTYNTKIIDLDTGTETNLSTGPIALQGTTVKVNTHLIAGFGGGASNYNSGQGMNLVRLFDTVTNTISNVVTLTNKTNQRSLAVVGNLIYFAEYNATSSKSNSVGYVDLTDNSVTYVDDVFIPTIQSLAVRQSRYVPSLNAILYGNITSQYYLYQLESREYTKDTVVLFQAYSNTAQYIVDLFTTNNFKTDVDYALSDAWFYKAGEGLETEGEVYYGNGDAWLPLVHGNTTGGTGILSLQKKTVELTEEGKHRILPDAGYDGLAYVDVIGGGGSGGGSSLNLFIQPDEPATKEGVWLQTDEELSDKIIVTNQSYVDETTLGTWVLGTTPSRSMLTTCTALCGDWIYAFGGVTTKATTKYNILTGETVELSDCEAEHSYTSAAVTIGTDIYIFGGSNIRTTTTQAYKYDTLTDTYTRLTDVPNYVFYGDAVAIGTDVFIACGQVYNSTKSTWNNGTLMYKYDTVHDTYESITAAPMYMYKNRMVAIGTDIYFLMGWASSTGTSTSDARKRIYKYDTITYERTLVAELDVAWSFSMGTGVVLGDEIYMLDISTGTNSEIGYIFNVNTLELRTDTNFNKKYSTNPCYKLYLHPTTNTLAFAYGVTNLYKMNYTQRFDYTGDEDTILMRQRSGVNKYQTVLTPATNVENRLLTSFEDVGYYSTETGINNNIPTYYGNGTEWIKIKGE